MGRWKRATVDGDVRNRSCQMPFHLNRQNASNQTRFILKTEGQARFLEPFTAHTGPSTLHARPSRPSSPCRHLPPDAARAWSARALFCSRFVLRFLTHPGGSPSNSQWWATLLPSLDPPPSIKSEAKFPGSDAGSTTCWLRDLEQPCGASVSL